MIHHRMQQRRVPYSLVQHQLDFSTFPVYVIHQAHQILMKMIKHRTILLTDGLSHVLQNTFNSFVGCARVRVSLQLELVVVVVAAWVVVVEVEVEVV